MYGSPPTNGLQAGGKLLDDRLNPLLDDLDEPVNVFGAVHGGTRLWAQFPEIMRLALERHDALLKNAVEAPVGASLKRPGMVIDDHCPIHLSPKMAPLLKIFLQHPGSTSTR